MEHLNFNSLTELARYLDSTERLPGSDDWSTRSQSAHECSFTWDESINLARNGGYWAEGATKLVQGVTDAAALRENYTKPMISNDVAGFAPDVPAYLAGVPDCMMAYDDGDMTTAQMPTVSIGIGTFSHGVSADSVMNRGIAIMSLVDSIEAVGYRVQIDFVGDNTGKGGLKKLRVVLKRPQDSWNPGAVAFATAHAAMLRRLTVATIERDPDSVERTHCGYGRGDDGYIEEYSMAFGYMTSNAGYSDLPSALRSVERIAADFGMEVKLTGSA